MPAVGYTSPPQGPDAPSATIMLADYIAGLPGNFSQVQVYGRYIDMAGMPMVGTVTFTASQAYLVDESADVIIFAAPLVATLDSTGYFEMMLPATDDPDLMPENFTWTVTESFNRGSGRIFEIAVPEDTPEPGINLVTVIPVVPADEFAFTVTSVDGETGDVELASTYAALDSEGKISPDALPPIETGVDSVNGETGAVSLSAADVSADPAGTGASAASAAVSTHVAAADPHGDRAYADGEITDAIAGITFPVTTVNGESGAVSLSAADVGADPAGTATSAVGAHTGAADPHGDRAYTDTQVSGITFPVTSVNGETGAVSLTASEVGAVATSQIDAASGVAGLDASGKLDGTKQVYATSGIQPVAATGSIGSANTAARGNHVHAGVTSINGSQGVVTLASSDVGALAAASNLSDVANAGTARTNLGLTALATAAFGTGAGTVTQGNDARVTGAAQKANNLSDLGSASTARTNLGLGGAAVLAVGTGAGDVAAGNAPASAITTHSAATDPHGDRAYADLTMLPKTGGTITSNLTVNGNLTVGGIGKTLFARKTSDESVTSSTTLQNDDQLLLPVVANATYDLFLLCVFSGGTTGDIKFDWTVPSGTVLRWADQTGSSGLNNTVDTYSAPGGTTQVAFQIWALVDTAGTAGNITFRWAQNASDTNATIVRANSYLKMTRHA